MTNKTNFTIIDNKLVRKGWQIFTGMQMAIILNLSSYAWDSINTELKAKKSKLAFNIETSDISWPSQLMMAKDIGTTQPVISNTVRQLVRMKVLEVKRQYNSSNIYRLNWLKINEILDSIQL